VATWETVRELALELPQTEESTSYRMPACKVAGKTFVNMSPHEEGALVVRVDPDERELLLASRPDLYFVTPHYEDHPLLLVRLEAIDQGELRERLLDAFELVSMQPR
jgi:hypothetical protein